MTRVKFAVQQRSDKKKQLVFTDDDKTLKVEPWASSKQTSSLHDATVNFFREVFLPEGFPDSVSRDYVNYQTYDTLQSFVNSICIALTTHAVLISVGVGNSKATVASATIAWLFKDASGMFGGMLFAYFKGSRLDSECKKWRLFADIVNDVNAVINLISPLFPSLFPVIQIISGLTLSMVGAAGGSTRAALAFHQARKDNVAEVSAKDGSQETMVNLVAFVINLSIVPLIVPFTWLVWVLFSALTALHVHFNFKAVTSVHFERFNLERLGHLLDHYLSSQCHEFLTVDQVNDLENVWFFRKSKFDDLIHVGVSVQEHLRLSESTELTNLMKLYEGCNYILSISKSNIGRNSIKVSLSSKANQETIFKAVFHGLLLNYYVIKESNSDRLQFDETDNLDRIHIETKDKVNEIYEKFKAEAIEAGFELDYIIIPDENWRFKLSE
ncbi:Protein root UVB sensitive 3 [Halotydeus destructor]|nr:Protein root UVB sensitive 3 [Halotydeus destructor]